MPFREELDLVGAVAASTKVVNLLITTEIAHSESTIMVGTKLYVNHRIVSTKDVALYSDDDGTTAVCQVHLHAVVDTNNWSIIMPWSTIEQKSRYRKCVIGDEFVIVASARLIASCIYSKGSVGQVSRVLMPCGYR